MPDRVRDSAAMIAAMSPALVPGSFVFCTLDGPTHPDAVATMREDEGLSQILPTSVARALGLDTALPLAQITLTVHSALDGIGLTAAVATALAKAGIACNVVAGHHHDHIFVPEASAEAALGALREIASG